MVVFGGQTSPKSSSGQQLPGYTDLNDLHVLDIGALGGRA